MVKVGVLKSFAAKMNIMNIYEHNPTISIIRLIIYTSALILFNTNTIY